MDLDGSFNSCGSILPYDVFSGLRPITPRKYSDRLPRRFVSPNRKIFQLHNVYGMPLHIRRHNDSISGTALDHLQCLWQWWYPDALQSVDLWKGFVTSPMVEIMLLCLTLIASPPPTSINHPTYNSSWFPNDNRVSLTCRKYSNNRRHTWSSRRQRRRWIQTWKR